MELKEQRISLETAKLAKKKGYPKKPLMYKKVGITHSGEDIIKMYVTQSLLQKWLREEHGWDASPILGDDNIWYSSICFMKLNQKDMWDDRNDSYEEALEFGLVEALKLL